MKCVKCGQKLIYALKWNMSATEQIFMKLTLAQRFVREDLLFQTDKRGVHTEHVALKETINRKAPSDRFMDHIWRWYSVVEDFSLLWHDAIQTGTCTAIYMASYLRRLESSMHPVVPMLYSVVFLQCYWHSSFDVTDLRHNEENQQMKRQSVTCRDEQLSGALTCKWRQDVAGIIGNIVMVHSGKRIILKVSANWAHATQKCLQAFSRPKHFKKYQFEGAHMSLAGHG
jgi:hypothetical protein